MIADLYLKLKELKVNVNVVGDRLDIQAPKGVLDKELLGQISANKEALIELINNYKSKAGTGRIIPRMAVQASYPMSAAQRRLWILSQSEEASVAYNMSGVYVFDGDLDRKAFRHACKEMIDRHESLRTVFREDQQGNIRQFILSPAAAMPQIGYHDLRHETAPEEMADQLLQDVLYKPFKLDTGLVRLCLYHLPENKWVFAYVIHHIVSDGWSMNVLINEIIAVYNATVKGNASPLSPLPIQYKDYVAWLQQQLSGASLAAHKNYWLQQLSGELPVLQLPSDKIRPALKTYNGAIYTKKLDANLVGRLKELCRRQGGTLYMGLLAAVNALCHRYTGLEDITIGTPVAGRQHLDLEQQIGIYANTLALRTRFKGSDNFGELFGQVKQVVMGAFEHQVYPFDELVEALKLQRDISRNPLFDIQVILQNAENRGAHSLQSLNGLSINAYEGTTKLISVFDMVFLFIEMGDALDARVIYNSDVFSEGNVAQMAAHLEQIINAILNDPAMPLQRLDYLRQDEKERLLKDFNNYGIDFGDANIIELFQRQVSRQPNAMAVVVGKNSLTYKELDEKSDQLAHLLKTVYGVQREDMIGVMLERSEKVVLSMLGIMKAGGVYVPLDPGYPVARKQFILQDTGIKVLLTLTDHIFDLDYYDGVMLALDVQLDAHEVTEPVLASEIKGDQLAYIIYTSGSTGQPKGVMIEHASLAQSIQAQQAVFELHAGERSLQFYSLSFDVSIFEVFIALVAGSELHVISEEDKKNPLLLEEFFINNKIDEAALPPAFLHLLQLNKITSLKKMIVGGEAVAPEKMHAFAAGREFFNAYGPTECTICSTIFKVDNERTADNSIPIGLPVPNTPIYILDDNLQLAPVGVPGEICIGGRGVGRGYLNNLELTNQQFIADPFSAGRIYRTGDIGKWLSDGNIVFMGRKDQQVKIRGYRIELGEIESVLQAHDAIEAAVVIARNGELIAYIVPNEKIEIAELRGWLSGHLPAYMIPAHFVKLEELPLTAHGKIDKRQLPDPDGAAESSSAYVAPRNEPERQLAAVYSEVLRKETVGIKDDFFVLGGDSIKAIQVVSRLRQRGYVVTVQDVLLHPVLEDLAALVKQPGGRVIEQGIVEGGIALTPIQKLFFSNASAVKHHYNQSILLESNEPLSETALRAALDKIWEHHDALRIVFDGEKQYNRGVAESYGWETSFEGIQESFNLSEGPLFKAALSGNKLLLIAHHLVMDGVSWRIILEDLATLYGQYLSGKQLLLPPKTDSYAYWQKQLEAYVADESYWAALPEVPALPTDMQGSNLVKDASSSWFMLDEEVTKLLLTQCYKSYRTDTNDVLVTALSLAIGNIFSIGQLALSMESHGREDIGADVTRTVGWFTSVYPVVINIKSDRIRQLIETKEQLHRVPNKGVGYAVLKYLKNTSINFNYLGDFDGNADESQPWKLSGEPHGNAITGEWHREALIDVTGITVEGKLRISITYSNKQYTAETIDKLSSTFQTEIENLVSDLSSTTATHLTPIDLTYKELSVEQLGLLSDIEDVYTLSPLQEGLYYQWLISPGSTAYFEQMSYRVKGNLDITLLQKSYNALVSRHAALRTSFRSDITARALQIVKKQVPPAFNFKDVSTDPGFSIQSFRAADRDKGFDLHDGSQMRLHVLQTGPGAYEFIWSHHHILMDGWCGSILVKEFLQLYYSLAKGLAPTLNKVQPYSNYIEWLNRQDPQASLQYWRNYLDGYDTLSTLPGKNNAGNQYKPRTMGFSLEPSTRHALRALCAELGITESSFIQAAWGILLSKYNSTEDAVFGAVVSGRPPELKGVEEMIGMFINTIPVRVKAENTATALQIIKSVHEAAIAGSHHHYTQLAAIQALSELKQGLFDHTLTFENFPVQQWEQDMGDEKIIAASTLTDVYDRNDFDFSMVVVPGEQFLFKFMYNEAAYDTAFMDQLKDNFTRILSQITEDASITVQQLDSLEIARHAVLAEQKVPDYTAGFSAAVSEDF